MLETFWHDLRYGIRMLAKHPGFAITAIISIALGVGAIVGMFSVADGLVLRPLPVPQAGRVVTVRISGRAPAGRIEGQQGAFVRWRTLGEIYGQSMVALIAALFRSTGSFGSIRWRH
jgi:hypothetical protein